MTYRPLVVPIADLRRHPGARRQFTESVELPGLGISSATVPEDASISLDLELETLSSGLVATGTITTPWVGECRRCLQPVEGRSVAQIREIFEPRPVEGETYAMAEDTVNLEPMVRDAVLLALPLGWRREPEPVTEPLIEPVTEPERDSSLRTSIGTLTN